VEIARSTNGSETDSKRKFNVLPNKTKKHGTPTVKMDRPTYFPVGRNRARTMMLMNHRTFKSYVVFKSHSGRGGGGGLQLGPLGTSSTYWSIVPAPGDYNDGEFGGMKIGRKNRSIRRKSAPAPLCPPQIPLDQNLDRTRAAALGSQRLTA
jgi:hypothetical protein